MKVLLVDDDAFLRDMYATKFIECGHTVEAVSEAKEAVSKMKEDNYDVVILDMIMPGMSGVDLLKEVSGLGIKGETKIIMLSNQSDVSDMSSAKEAGADGYIVKAESIPSEVVKRVEELAGV